MREWKRIIASFLAGIILFSAVPGNVYAEEKQKKEGEETAVTWEKAPKLSRKAPKLKDGEVQDGIYGEPEEPMTGKTLEKYQAQSEDARIEADPTKELEVEKELVGPITFIYVNGESYIGGDLTVMEGDNFSYSLSWEPKVPNGTADIMTWEEGSWFETVLFQVPGLNLPSVSNVSLNINGIKVGEYSLTYNKDQKDKDNYGKMTYKVVFNRYIQFFKPSTIKAFVQGSGRFSEAPVSGPIVHGSDEGTLTVTPRPDVPSVTPVPEGTGWKPSKAPTFNDDGYPFGKGVKWNSSKDPNAQANEIEWRVVFLEQLQKTQRQFLEALKDNKEWTPPESKEYVIIEDTLDANQKFHIPTAAHDKKKYGEAPFFLELPVMIPGTDNILNAASNVGNDDYDGPGEIWTFYSGGKQFEKIEGKYAVTQEDIDKVKAEVKNRPLSWTVTTDPKTRQETLTINAGKLGTTDPTQGMSWKHINNWDKWPTKEVENKIKECDNKINALQTGLDSPLALIERRATELNNLLNRCVELPQNEGKKEEIKNDIKAWHDDYVNWREDPKVSYLQPLDRQNEETKDWELIRPLPNLELIEKLKDCVATTKNTDVTAVKDTQEYKNYVLSLENLQRDQRTYVEHRKEYGKDWENAKENYEKTLKFYQHPGVYGFVVKVRTESINPSMGTYSNRVNVTLEDKKWSAEDEASVEFKGGIVGSYNLGDVLFQKADHTYDSGDKDKVVEDIQKVEKDKAGLAGAEFQMYCGTAEQTPPNLDEKNLAHFLDRDASLNGKTYIYTHTGEDHVGNLQGDVNKLVTDDEGKLAVSRIVPGHYHWLVETKAPKGYYLSPTPIQVKNNNLDVSYQMLPNVARSVRLEKRDSFSKLPVEGAEFELFKVEADGTQTPVTGFKTKNVDGHQEGKQTYWVDEKGKEPLKTNSAGVLCIHGLDAGKYNLLEKTPAPGYKMPNPIPAYEFDLEEELPDKTDAFYDDNYHYLLTPDTPLENEPDVAALTMTKTGVGNVRLENAGFALFRFTESEEKWKENPDNEDYWEIVDLTPEPTDTSPYFKTKNQVEDVTVTGDSIWAGRIPAVMTNSDGKLEITDIPVGHYSIAEVKVPSTYQRDQRSFYFTVKGELQDGQTVMSPLQLYTEPNEKNELKDNTLKNYQKLAQIALVKYDKDDGEPEIAGEKLQGRDGWRFTEDVLKDPDSKGLAGAVFKLFMRRGASVGQTNPYPKELEDSEKILGYKQGYDTCVAMGTTDANGVLKLEDMKGANGNSIQGLNPENYYMIEVKAPEGYLLDQEPVHFSLDEKIFEVPGEATPGLVMTAENSKVDYGLRLRKVDGKAENHTTAVGLAGARFKVEQGDKLLYFTGIPGADGEYKAVAEGTKDAVSEIVTGENGKLTIVGLKSDTKYKFTETRPPRGYKIPEGDDNSIEITTAGSAQKGILEDGVLFPENITQMGNERLTGKVLLHKQATETMEALAGAEFALYETKVTVIPPGDSDYDPNNDGATRSEDVLVRGYDPNNPDSDPDAERLVTDKDGNLEITGLPWNEKKNESYYLVETKAPEGYVLDQTKWRFTIDENSFRADGTVIPVQFPAVINSRGTLGEAVLVKADVDDHDKKLEDAHFYLEKYIWTDAAGEEVWAGYSQGMFMTDKDGEIRFLLPPGRYRLLEMKAPDGYVLEGMKPLYFTIEDAQEGSKPPLVVIDEDGSKDGVVTNRQGEAGIYFKKTLKGTERALEGVKFKVCWGITDLKDPETLFNPIEDDPFYFIHEGGGNYTHTTDSTAPGVTTELVTNENGEIYAMLPKSLKKPTDKYPNTEEEPRYLFSLMWKETEAPDMVEKPYESGGFELKEGIFVDTSVENTLSAEAKKDFTLSVQKTDGKSKRGLEGAEFKLSEVHKIENEKLEFELATGASDENGDVKWKDALGTPLDEKGLAALLIEGNTYHIQETKAPEGYVLDETVHEITWDEKYLDENLYWKPILLHLQNYQKSGSVHLKKVEKGKPDEGLAGAEFELLRKTEDADPLDNQWEHYGEERYITDKNGELLIEDLPYGSYQLVERAAPLGYLLDDPAPTLSFQIAEDGDSVELGSVENALDPNPVRDVHVKKVAAEDKDKVLPGAKFELYERKADGEYHIRQKNVYVTDAKGGFTIEKLPVGSYALKEIEAPTGYDVPDENMTYFAVRRQDREVRLEIENAKSENEGNPETLLTVQKVWEDNDAGIRPDSVSVQLYRNGQAHGKPVKLTEKNGWKHTWESLDSKYTWFADEVEVPKGYEKSVERKGNKWVITNTLLPGVPVNPENPDDSEHPDNPNSPNAPDNPNSADSTNTSSEPGRPGDKANRNSQTGDNAKIVLWLLLLGLSAAEVILVWKRTRGHRKRKK